jgi:hypothetical protein
VRLCGGRAGCVTTGVCARPKSRCARTPRAKTPPAPTHCRVAAWCALPQLGPRAPGALPRAHGRHARRQALHTGGHRAGVCGADAAVGDGRRAAVQW